MRFELPDRTISMGPGKQQCLLACLLCSPGQPVSADVLVDRLWGAEPPERARNLLATYASRLRTLLAEGGEGPRVLRYSSGGYLIDVDPERVDLHRARRLATEAADTSEASARALLLRQALAGWQPVALAGVPGEWAHRMRQSLQDERLDLLTRWAEAELQLGNGRLVADELRAAAEDAPFHEALHARLIVALARSGRPAAAAAAYAEIRDRLRRELGVEPGPELRAARAQATGGEAPTPSPSPSAPLSAAAPVPAQLPPDVADFTGRQGELDHLEGLLSSMAALAAPVVCTIHGTAGVGKTALAVHWAHLVRDRFPDGQLYLNLRGFDPSGTPLSPEIALQGLITALGVPDPRIPPGLAERSALYRSLLADRTALVILDNARSPEQVRPLLPGGSRCAVLVTSRDPLVGLVATEHARSLELDLLSPQEAYQFLARRLGRQRVDLERAAVDTLIARCARLPLALAVAAARAVVDARLPLTTLAAQLRPLDPDLITDAAADLSSVFGASYRTLSPAAAAMFRAIGLHPSPALSAAAAASLAGASAGTAAAVLDELRQAHLVERDGDGQFAMHDLLHAYAAELALAHDAAKTRDTAWQRLTSHYLHATARADGLLNPARTTIPLVPVAPGVVVESLHSHDQAMAWVYRNHHVLKAVLLDGRTAALPEHILQLAYHLTPFLQRHGYWQDEVTLQRAACEVAARTGDLRAQARARRAIGRAQVQLGQYATAHEGLRLAAELYRAAGDLTGQASAHLDVAWVRGQQEQPEEALAQALQALALLEDRDDPAETSSEYAYALNCVGWYETQLHRHRQALERCTRAVEIHARTGDRRGQAETLHSIGYIRQQLGQLSEAVSHYEQALSLYREIGDRHGEGETLTHLGDAHRAADDTERARLAWQQALDTLSGLRHPSAQQVQARLDGLDAVAGLGLGSTGT